MEPDGSMTQKQPKVPLSSKITLVGRATTNRGDRVDTLTTPFLAVWTRWKGYVDNWCTVGCIGRSDHVWHDNLDRDRGT